MNTQTGQVSVIIRTLADRRRTHSLKRALTSIWLSSQNPVSVIVIVNGRNYDPELTSWLENQANVIVDYISEASVTLATIRGRELVNTAYFSFLDDDDEYLPGSTDLKLAVLQNNPDADLVVTNGWINKNGQDFFEDLELDQVEKNPLRALFRENWLHNCNALFRTDTILVEYFSGHKAMVEWTWFAFQLAMSGKKISTLKDPTYRYFDTENSASKSTQYDDSFLSLFDRMLAANPPHEIVQLIKRKIVATWHDRSTRALFDANSPLAWYCHFKSLSYLVGWRYFFYTRHLLLHFFQRRRK